MGYYTVNHNGSTVIEEDDKEKKVKYEEDEPIEDIKKGQLEHVPGAEYHTGKPDDKEDSDEKE